MYHRGFVSVKATNHIPDYIQFAKHLVLNYEMKIEYKLSFITNKDAEAKMLSFSNLLKFGKL